MTMSVTLVDYGAGNLHSVENALRRVGAEVEISADPDALRTAERLVLPGVGSFRACAQGLAAIPGAIEAMHERVFVGGAPFLGICVGMQLLATTGYEHGETPGLGWIAGSVRRIEPADPSVKVPHMGWNDVEALPHAAANGVVIAGEAYFLHSYHFRARHSEDVLAMTDHGGGLTAAVGRANMIGVQFHPEKSQAFGLALLERFLAWKP